MQLSNQKRKHITEAIHRVMDERRPFLRDNYSLQDLAADTEVPPYMLSNFINRELGLNFTAFVNHYRVLHCEELFQRGLYLTENLDNLARHCGFANRNSLTAAFKRITGFTPSRYQRGWARLLSWEGNE